MFRKIYFAFVLVTLLGLLATACAKKEETEPATETAEETPAIVPGEMVLIPGGEYTIGTDDNEADADRVAHPEHKVKLNAFWIDKYEVTNKEFLDFSIDHSYAGEGAKEGKTWRTFFSPEKANYPVVYITYKDAQAYCEANGKRLPTEEEWEAAARGPEAYRYPWGNQWAPNSSNTYEAAYHAPMEIGMFPGDVSPFGVRDMLGNVQEWTASAYKAYPGNRKADPNFRMGWQVLRGASSRMYGARYYLWIRTAYLPNFLADFGCRCAKDATPEEAAKAAQPK